MNKLSLKHSYTSGINTTSVPYKRIANLGVKTHTFNLLHSSSKFSRNSLVSLNALSKTSDHLKNVGVSAYVYDKHKFYSKNLKFEPAYYDNPYSFINKMFLSTMKCHRNIIIMLTLLNINPKN